MRVRRLRNSAPVIYDSLARARASPVSAAGFRARRVIRDSAVIRELSLGDRSKRDGRETLPGNVARAKRSRRTAASGRKRERARGGRSLRQCVKLTTKTRGCLGNANDAFLERFLEEELEPKDLARALTSEEVMSSRLRAP